jgi:hypothetical protein
VPDKRTLRPTPSLFRKTVAVVPELEQLDSQTAEQPTDQSAKQQDAQAAKPPRVKATFYLTAEDVIAIDTMQTNEFRSTGKKPERSELVSRAIQELFSRSAS